MSYQEATDQTGTGDDLWHVQLPTGDVCMMSLDQLDDAFQSGVISESTYLWQEGATGWVTLREVAGLDSDDDSVEDVSALAEPVANPFVQPDYASESVWPSAPAANIYPSQSGFMPAQHVGPHSTAPVVSPMRDMDFDLDSIEFKKKKHPGRWLFAAALVGAAGFGAVKYNLIPIPGELAPVVAASPLPPIEVAPPPVAPPPVVAAPAPAPEPAKALPDDVKQRLANADKVLAEKQKQKQQQLQQRHSSAPRASRKSSGEKVFTKGGETGDPLNAAL